MAKTVKNIKVFKSVARTPVESRQRAIKELEARGVKNPKEAQISITIRQMTGATR